MGEKLLGFDVDVQGHNPTITPANARLTSSFVYKENKNNMVTIQQHIKIYKQLLCLI
jgi:hypothetical protein